MADLKNPTVTVSYACGCSFTDDTETGGTPRFRFGGDETRVFQTKRSLEGKTGVGKRSLLDAELAKITDTVKPTRAALEALATPDDIYLALLERDATEVTTIIADGIRFPQPPGICPRHGQPAWHTHASYLNPADVNPDERLARPSD